MNLSLLLYLPKIRWRVWFSPKFGGQLWGYLSNCHVNRETIIINDDSYLPDSARPMRGRNFQKNEMAIRNQWPIEKEQWLVEVVVHQRMWKWWFRCGWNDIIRTLTRETEWSDEPLTRMNERTTERTKEWAMNKWNGTKWNEMERNGTKWNEMEWNGMKWNEMEWSGKKWNEMEWNGMKWNEVARNGMKWNEMEWNGMKWNEGRKEGMNERTNQQTKESMIQRINTSTNESIIQAMDEWCSESMNQWIGESKNQWLNKTMIEWISESMT